jgi:hypothetical protein
MELIMTCTTEQDFERGMPAVALDTQGGVYWRFYLHAGYQGQSCEAR